MKAILLICAIAVINACAQQPKPIHVKQQIPGKIIKTDEEWREILTEEQYNVTRKKATEKAYTGSCWNMKEPGNYYCVCCNVLLFVSEKKFDSGTGWPSFTKPVNENCVTEIPDNSFGMSRTEVTCSKCDAHLGHVFDDGPAPEGKRYCINSVSLKYVKK